MTVAERGERNGSRDQFPIGMRILAVDDDPTCLKVLESLLVRCKYHVTTANQAVKALEMLRENTDQFDLVISDVHMPDMDGFKLLELVGLEMDLPVIMLSANGETQAVMKGITHGACDYLLKPVRIEELKNIWQHVIRRKKFDGSDQNSLDNGEDRDKNPHANSEGAQNSLANSSSDRNMKLNRKRKDQNEEDEDDDDDDNLHENEDPSAQKKPRVVWSVELHRKFVAAVNHLGIDKAVPKRILDLMNVEGLTRENVASHLQKYRLYLKRLSAVANQQANMVAALRGRDPSYHPMGSLDSYTNFIGSRPLANCTSFQPNGSVPRMNTFTGFGLHGFVPPSTSQLGHTLNNTTNPINNLTKLQGNQQGTLIQPKAIQDASKTLLSGFSSPVNSFTNLTKIPQMLQSNQSSLRAAPLSSDPFDLGRCNETWQGAVLSSTYTGSTMSLPFNRNDVSSSSNIRNNISPIVSQNQASPLLTATSANGDANLYNFRSLDNSNLKWEDPGQVHARNPKFSYNSASNPSVSNIHVTDQMARNQKLGMDMPIMNQTSFGAPLIAQDSRSDNVSVGGRLNYKDEPLFEDMKLIPGGFSSGSFGLDDLVSNAMIKPECDDFTFIDGDMGYNDLYSLGACM